MWNQLFSFCPGFAWIMKYILVTGGVISGIGKGIIASSVGTILKSCGLHVTAIKIDPYINIDAGTFSPYEHGEFICTQSSQALPYFVYCLSASHTMLLSFRWSVCAGWWWWSRSGFGKLRTLSGYPANQRQQPDYWEDLSVCYYEREERGLSWQNCARCVSLIVHMVLFLSFQYRNISRKHAMQAGNYCCVYIFVVVICLFKPI